MKKNIILASVLLVGLLTITSCTQDDSVSNEKLQQKDGSSVSFTSPTARFVAVNGTYTAIPSKDYEFTSILLSGNNVVNITISNSGSVAANMEVLGNNGYYLIGSKQIPTGGGYYIV